MNFAEVRKLNAVDALQLRFPAEMAVQYRAKHVTINFRRKVV